MVKVVVSHCFIEFDDVAIFKLFAPHLSQKLVYIMFLSHGLDDLSPWPQILMVIVLLPFKRHGYFAYLSFPLVLYDIDVSIDFLGSPICQHRILRIIIL